MTSGDSLLLLESDPPPSYCPPRALRGHLQPAHPPPTSQQRPGLWSSEDTIGWLASPPWGPLHSLRSLPGPLLSGLPGLGRGRGVAPEKPSPPRLIQPHLIRSHLGTLGLWSLQRMSPFLKLSCTLVGLRVPLPLLEQASGGKLGPVPRARGVPRMQ